MSSRDLSFMRLALREADNAAMKGEVPVGCVLVDGEDRVITFGHNLREDTFDPSAHAEMIALRAASAARSNFRLSDVTAYVTLEPCAMCAGALVLARVRRVVYGCLDAKAGAFDSHFGIGRTEVLNHQIEIVGGVLADDCRDRLQQFFRAMRQRGARDY